MLWICNCNPRCGVTQRKEKELEIKEEEGVFYRGSLPNLSWTKLEFFPPMLLRVGRQPEKYVTPIWRTSMYDVTKGHGRPGRSRRDNIALSKEKEICAMQEGRNCWKCGWWIEWVTKLNFHSNEVQLFSVQLHIICHFSSPGWIKLHPPSICLRFNVCVCPSIL